MRSAYARRARPDRSQAPPVVSRFEFPLQTDPEQPFGAIGRDSKQVMPGSRTLCQLRE